MALTVYPLNNIDYQAEDVALYTSTRTSGIYAGDDFSFTMTGADNTISVDVGLAWLRLSRFFGVAAAHKVKTAVDMGLPDTTYPRIDALVLQFDANKNGADLVVKAGKAASNPQPPAVSRTEALYELHLLHVLRKAGAAAITAADVTDLRMDERYCGLMADSVTKVDTSVINAQVTALIEELRRKLRGVEDQTYYASKEYVDGTQLMAELPVTGWVGSEAPYTQTVLVDEIQESDNPDYFPLYSADQELRVAEKRAFACLDLLVTSNGSVTVTCFEDKPETDVVIGMEVHR